MLQQRQQGQQIASADMRAGEQAAIARQECIRGFHRAARQLDDQGAQPSRMLPRRGFKRGFD